MGQISTVQPAIWNNGVVEGFSMILAYVGSCLRLGAIPGKIL